MLFAKILLILEAGTCFAVSSTEQRIDVLELRLDNALNRTEKDILDLKDTIEAMGISECTICEEELVEVLNETKEEIDLKDSTSSKDKESKTTEEEIKRVYEHIEKNSKAIMDEFQNTLTVLIKQHRNINQKIKSNANNIRKLEHKTPMNYNERGFVGKKLKHNNANIAKFEDKLSILDDNLHELRKDFEAYNRHFNDYEQRLSKLDKHDYDIGEDIEKNYQTVASIDHSLVEMDRRYQEFASDLDTFKTDIRNEIDEIKQELHISPDVIQVETKTCPTDWIQHGSTCYLYNKTTGEDWETALRICKTLGAKLAEPDTKETMNYLRRFVHGWIGASDISNEGVFIWESSKKAVEYFPWWPGMPDNFGGNQDCASIWGTMINDENCSKRYRYVCEKELQ